MSDDTTGSTHVVGVAVQVRLTVSARCRGEENAPTTARLHRQAPEAVSGDLERSAHAVVVFGEHLHLLEALLAAAGAAEAGHVSASEAVRAHK